MRAYKAFVSSTYIDLKEHRLYVIDAVRKAGFHVDPMEDWTADSDEPKAFSQERVDDCDLCILLVAFRRGHVPDGEAKSITQMEYEHAVTNGIDVLPFLLGEKAPWSRDFDELEKDPSLQEWRAELKEHRGVGFFALGPESVQIAPALTRWLHKRKETEGPAISYWLSRPPSLEGSFVGRSDDMDRLVRDFSDRRVVVVSGGAGTGKSRTNLAIAYLAGGREAEAMRLFEETLAARERVLGADHPATLESRYDLDAAYRSVGRDENAARLEGKSPGKSKPKRKGGGRGKG